MWVYRYSIDGRDEAVTFARWPWVKLEAARKRRASFEEIVIRGERPSDTIRKERLLRNQRVTVREFGRRFVKEVVEKVRKDPGAVSRYLERDVYPKLGRQPMCVVDPWEIQKMIFKRRDDGKPEAAAALRHLLKRLFDYAKSCGVLPRNPVDMTPLRYVTQHRSRIRYLSEEELKLFFKKLPALRPPRLAVALEIMLLTLCRKSELRLARWEHVHFDKATWELPAELSKMGTEHIFYLSSRAAGLFQHLKTLAGESPFVLPQYNSTTQPLPAAALNKAISRVDWGMPHFCLHDLRRTGSTHLNERGYNADWIEKAMNHTPLGVRGTYNRALFGAERKQMLAAWADYLEGLK
jgi:integrase